MGICEILMYMVWSLLLYYSIYSFPIAFIFRYHALSCMNAPNPFTTKKLIRSFVFVAILSIRTGIFESTGSRTAFGISTEHELLLCSEMLMNRTIMGVKIDQNTVMFSSCETSTNGTMDTGWSQHILRPLWPLV